MLYVIATLTIDPRNLQPVLDAAAPCLLATRKEDGCLSYDLHQSVSDSGTLVFVERWRDREALDRHLGQPHLQLWRKLAAPHLTSKTVEVISDGRVEQL